MENQISTAWLAGIFTVIGALISTIGALLKDCLNSRTQFRIEKIRLHDRDRIEAYKRLFAFTGRLSGEVFPLAENKDLAFREIMTKQYFGTLENDYVYFTDDIAEILEELKDWYICMTRPELIPETETERVEFAEEKLLLLTEALRKEAKKELRSRRKGL